MQSRVRSDSLLPVGLADYKNYIFQKICKVTLWQVKSIFAVTVWERADFHTVKKARGYVRGNQPMSPFSMPQLKNGGKRKVKVDLRCDEFIVGNSNFYNVSFLTHWS